MKQLYFILLFFIVIISDCFTSTIHLDQPNSSLALQYNQNNDNENDNNLFICLIFILLILILVLLFVYLMSVKSDKEIQLDNRIKELRSYINVIRNPDNTLNETTIKQN
jgi:hypothetical protein